MKKAAPALAAALLLVLAGACSDDEPTSSADVSAEKAVIASMAGTIATPDGGLLSEEDATCVATAFVQEVGVAKLRTIKAVDAEDAYVSGGALTDPATASSFTDALLGCREEADVLAAVETTSTEGYAAMTSGVLSPAPVSCTISAFVEDAGVEQLFTSGFLDDAGAFNPGKPYDEDTAAKFATALLGCVDYTRILAQDSVARNKNLSLAKLTTCLRREIDAAELKASVVARLTAAADAGKQLAATQQKTVACEKTSRK